MMPEQIAAITGHTSGIGLAISNRLQQAGYKIQGFSRSTGHALPGSVSRIIHEAMNCDIFVNNAFVYYDNSQIALLYAMYERWQDIAGKVIINISSRAGDCTMTGRSEPYSTYKKALDTACLQLANIPRPKCRVMNVKPGFVDTPSVAGRQIPKLHANDVADAVMWMLNQPPHVFVTSVALRPFD
jgi:NADP-dependent 3-hydroxy acid dehydrogenase YdfG